MSDGARVCGRLGLAKVGGRGSASFIRTQCNARDTAKVDELQALPWDGTLTLQNGLHGTPKPDGGGSLCSRGWPCRWPIVLKLWLGEWLVS